MTTTPLRHSRNPLLTASDVSYPCSLLFNAGVVKYQGKYVMVFRNDYGARSGEEYQRRLEAGEKPFVGTNLGIAYSEDGVKWSVQSEPCIDLAKARKVMAPMMDNPEANLWRFYDPRLTVLDGKVYMCFAVDTEQGVRGGVAITEDFDRWEILSISVPDNRNMVLFPEKIGGRYARFERPVNAFGGNFLTGSQAQMWQSFSPDLRHWGDSRFVLNSDRLGWANDKMGPGAPPIRTEKGWLTAFHAVTRDDTRGKNGWEGQWPKIYRAGLMLMDLERPWKIIGMAEEPLLSPETWYETGEDVPADSDFEGFRNHVIFPGGMILEDDGEVKIYYGAADTVECLATAHVDDLLALCVPVG